jgi:hypothetical protein
VHKRIFSRGRLAIIGATVAMALAGGGAAFAYFTSTGSGTGTGSVGSSTAYSVAVSAPASGPISPGSTGETFTYTVTNNDNGTQDVTGATISVAPGAAAALAGCTAALADYSISGPGITTSGNPATQTHVSIPISGRSTESDPTVFAFTLSMGDTGTNQDDCEGDVPVVTVAVS